MSSWIGRCANAIAERQGRPRFRLERVAISVGLGGICGAAVALASGPFAGTLAGFATAVILTAVIGIVRIEQLGWSKRNARRAFAIAVMLTALCGLLAMLVLQLTMVLRIVDPTGVFALLLAISDSLHKIPVAILNLVLGTDVTADEKLQAFVKEHLLTLTFVTVVAISAWPLRKVAGVLRRRAFTDFNDDVLTPIRYPQAFDPLWGAIATESDKTGRKIEALPFVTPRSGARKAAWDRLHAFATPGAELPRGQPEPPFQWALLVGRGGSGKTRLAQEFARSLAQRNDYGDARGAPRKGMRWRLRVWVKLHVGLGRTAAVAPWDAGWIKPSGPPEPEVEPSVYPTRQGRSALSIEAETLKTWRPRRPTLLLVDDPAPGDVQRTVEALSLAMEEFRYPVRLLIVSQTVPDNARGLRHQAGPPIAFPDAARFEAADIRSLRGRALPVNRKSLVPNDTEIDRFLHETGGNPLLVEIAFHKMRTERLELLPDPFRMLGREELLRARVHRIKDAFDAAGLVYADHEFAMAVATLADGVAWDTLASRLRSATPGHEVLRAQIFTLLQNRRRLAPVYSIDQAELDRALPPIRPQLVGEAFVRQTVSRMRENSPELAGMWAEALVETAWAANPVATLRNGLRLADQDILGPALARMPIGELGISPLSFALTYAEAAMRIPREDWDIGDVELPKGLLEAAIEKIQALAPCEAEAAIDAVMDLAGVSNGVAIIRGPVAQRLLLVALGRALDNETAFTGPTGLVRALDVINGWLNALNRWGVPALDLTGYGVVRPGQDNVVELLFERLAETLSRDEVIAQWDRLDALASDLIRRRGNFTFFRPAVFAGLSRLTRQLTDAAQHRAFRARCDAGEADLVSDPARANAAFTLVEAINSDEPFPEPVSIQIAEALASIVDAAETEERFKAFALLEELAGRSNAPRIIEARLRAYFSEWDRARRTSSGTPKFEAIEETLQRLPRNAETAAMFAKLAWYRIMASHHDPLDQGALIKELRRFLTPWRDRWDLVESYFVALNIESGPDEIDQRSYVAANRERIKAIPTEMDEYGFDYTGFLDIELQRAIATMNFTVLEIGNMWLVLHWARKVDRLARRFPEDHRFAHCRARAWTNVAAATLSAPQHDAVCEDAVQEVDRIWRRWGPRLRFLGQGSAQVPFIESYLQAWAHAAAVRRGDPVACRQAVFKIEAINRYFRNQGSRLWRGSEAARAAAWRALAVARKDHQRGAEAAVRRVEQAVEGLMGTDADIRILKLFNIQAWLAVTHSRRHDRELAREAAERLDGWAAEFADDPEFINIRQQAWAFVQRCDPLHAQLPAIEQSSDSESDPDVASEQTDAAAGGDDVTSAPTESPKTDD